MTRNRGRKELGLCKVIDVVDAGDCHCLVSAFVIPAASSCFVCPVKVGETGRQTDRERGRKTEAECETETDRQRAKEKDGQKARERKRKRERGG